MLRSFLLYLSKAVWAKKLVTSTQLGWRAASRFIAGESMTEVIPTVNFLNDSGVRVTLDYLGEHTTDRDQALNATELLIKIIQKIREDRLRSGISIKLTQIGLDLGESLCLENLLRVVAEGAAGGIFVRIDMEDSSWVEKTLRLYRCARDAYGSESVGVVIQSYLYRSEADVRELMAEGSRIRLCKGAYLESPDVAFPQKKDVDLNFDRLMKIMVDASREAARTYGDSEGIIPPLAAFATHDPERIRVARGYHANSGLPRSAIEFQMLYGIRKDLQQMLVKENFPVRVYIPFGEQWYPYFMRRLAERPANVWFFIRQYFQ
ncbi:MAG TPA: proline dehydrogenase family protein [Anaerolineales bacterium]|nr:proline dehydrogenase family protein [Anaerolineales bacterium]